MNALELADDLKYVRKYSDSEHWDTLDAVATELRRLYEENQRCRDVCAATAEGWREDRDALLEALREIERSTYDAGTAALARVAIAKAEEKV